MQGVPVAVVDAAGVEWFADRAQLVAGGKECDPQTPLHLHFRYAKRRQQAQIGWMQHPALRKSRLSRLQVFSLQSPVVARLDHS